MIYRADKVHLTDTLTGALARELERIDRWHATFNAVLAGVLANPNGNSIDAAMYAEMHADSIHGRLK